MNTPILKEKMEAKRGEPQVSELVNRGGGSRLEHLLSPHIVSLLQESQRVLQICNEGEVVMVSDLG